MYIEKLAKSISVSLALLLIGVFAVCIGIAPMYNWLVDPQIKAFHIADQVRLVGGNDGGIWLIAQSGAIMGGFGALAVFGIVAVILFMMIINIRSTALCEVRTPYLCGENLDADIRGLQFTGPGEKPADVIVRNYYFMGMFGEEKLTLILNLGALALILLMFGVVLR